MGKVALRVSLFSLALGGLCPKSVSAAVAYLQGAYATPRTPQTTVQVTFAAAQKTGSLNRATFPIECRQFRIGGQTALCVP